MYKFYINDNELEDSPAGWDKFTQTITRDINQRRITISYPVDLVFYGTAFNVFYNAINNDGYNATFDFKAIKEDEKGFLVSDVRGIIFLIDVEFDLTHRTATTQIKENGFISKLLGNVNNPISLPSLQTKNGFDMSSDSRVILKITSSTPAMGGATVFNNNAGGTTSERWGVDVWKALQEMTVHMSDGEVAMKSSYFDSKLSDYNTNGDPYMAPLCMMRGKELRLGSYARELGSEDYLTKVTFNQLFEAVSRLFNLYFYPDTTVQPPMIRLEGESGFFPKGTPTIEMESPEHMTLSYYQELFYSTVKMGSANTLYEKGNTATNVLPITFVTHKSDEYYLTGQSNVDRTLDLTLSRFVIDSNVIRDVLINNNNAYDDNIFLIQYIPKEATFDDYWAGVSLFDRPESFEILKESAFNGALINEEVAKNHNFFGAITNNLTDVEVDNRCKYLTGGNDIIQKLATKDSEFTEKVPPKYTEIVFDYSAGDFVPQLGEYTAELSGSYTIKIKTVIDMPTLVAEKFYDGEYKGTGDTLTAEIIITTFDGANEVESRVLSFSEFTSVGLYTTTDATTLTLRAGERVKVNIVFHAYNDRLDRNGARIGTIISNIGWAIMPGGYFHVSSCARLDLSYVTTEQTNEYKGTRVILNHFMDEAQIKKVIANPQQSIKLLNFVEHGADKDCWIKNIKINRETGNVEGEFITNIVKETL